MNASPFNKTNLFIFLIELGFSLLFLFMFTCIHYGITNATKWGKRVQKSKMFNFWYFFIFGFLLSLVTFIVSQVSSIALGAIGMPLTILGLIYAMTIFYNRSVQMGAIIPTILWILYQYNGFKEYNFEWFIRLIVVLIIASMAIITTFIKWKKLPTFLISCLITFILLIALILTNVNQYTGYYCSIAAVSILSTVVYYIVLGFLNRWLTHVSRMARQGAYIDQHYLIPTVLDEYFSNYISKNNVSQALVVSLHIEANEKNKRKALDDIYNLFKNENALFFKSSFETYGVILSHRKYQINNLNISYQGNKTKLRDDNDELKYLEQQISSLNNAKASINAYVSIYGVHSCRLDSLLKDNNYAFKHDDFEHDHNIVQLFNTNLTNQEINDNNAFLTLSQKVNLNDINVELEILRMNKSKKLYVCPRYYWPKKLTCSVDTITSQFGITISNTLLRHLASRSLEMYANDSKYHLYPILIYYPIDQLNSNEWSLSNYLKKIHLYGLERNQIILSFNVAKYKVWPKQVINHLFELQNHSIKYMLVDVNNINGIKKLKPTAIILSKRLTKLNVDNKLQKQFGFNIL